MRHRHPRPRERGQASVELALLLPVVVVLLLAVLQVGLLARDVVLVTHASREAARAAATDPRPNAGRDAALRSSGLDPARIDVIVTGRAGPGSRVVVAVSYRARLAVPIIGSLIGDRTIRSTTTMLVEAAPAGPGDQTASGAYSSGKAEPPKNHASMARR